MNNKTTAENLESKFDQGEDVMDYFDLAKARRPLLEKGADQPGHPALDDRQD